MKKEYIHRESYKIIVRLAASKAIELHTSEVNNFSYDEAVSFYIGFLYGICFSEEMDPKTFWIKDEMKNHINEINKVVNSVRSKALQRL